MSRRALLVAVLMAPTAALAQPWTPPKGTVVTSLSYQYVDGGDHLFSSNIIRGFDFGSNTRDLGDIESQVVFFNAEVGITDRLALQGGVPFISARYRGDNGENPAVDNGSWQSGLQDIRIGARYSALRGTKWLLTPRISYGFPSSDYNTIGHAVRGRGLTELRLGADTGRVISFRDRPSAYFQAGYSYVFMEDTDIASLDRSDVYSEFGYFLPKFVTLTVFSNYQNVHGGLDWARDLPPLEPDEHADEHDHAHNTGLLVNHDVVAATNLWLMGGGVSVPLSRKTELFGNVSRIVWGRNTHGATSVTVGVQMRFRAFGRQPRIGE